MKQTVKQLQGDAILARDGALGQVLDVTASAAPSRYPWESAAR